MLFYIDERDLTILNPECVKLCPELAPLVTNQEILQYIIIVYDNDSPYKQWPESARQRRAIERIWNNKPPSLETTIVLNAIDAYKSLQYNPKVELIKVYNQKVESVTAKIQGEDDEKKLDSYSNIITKFRKFVRDLEMELSLEKQEIGQIKGDQEKSWIEIMQRNKDNYAAIVKKKPAKDGISTPPLY